MDKAPGEVKRIADTEQLLKHSKGEVAGFKPGSQSCARPKDYQSSTLCSHDCDISEQIRGLVAQHEGPGTLGTSAGLGGSADVSHRDAGVVAAPACRSRGLGTSSTWQTCPHPAGG